MPDVLSAEFRAAMARFEPFCPRPRLTVGVSGGADSTALALLAKQWVNERGGEVLALIVDHGLRSGSGAEASITRRRLEARDIPARVITLTGLGGPKLQETARHARHVALAKATRDAGALFLLLGHHASDQSETVAMRALRGNSGLEAMAGWTARNDAVLLRPLLSIAPERLRAFLQHEGMQWVEDPSNQDPRFERVRLRLAGVTAAAQDPAPRRAAENAVAAFLAREAIIRPEGFAIFRPDSCPPAALAALLRTIGGRQYAPRQEAVRRLAGKLQPATLGGVRLMKASRFGPGWLLVRETAACAPPIPARRGQIWDGRFCLLDDVEDGLCGAAGAEAAMFRNVSNLPAAVLGGLPCIRLPGSSGAKPRLAKAFFAPPAPAAALPFGSAPVGPF
jgi:tRNA(Ile)-lysidine synthase